MSPIRAAGILYLTSAGHALFLQRGPTGDHAGEWCLPGGCVEEGETAEAAARREAREELGSPPKGELVLHTRQVRDVVGGGPATPALTEGAVGPVTLVPELPAQAVDYTTFLQRVPEPFEVKINSESTAYAWAPVDHPPQPLHPGVGITISRLGMDELEVALAMSQGQLTSPQRYENVSLFLMRITGTGTAYRTKINEYVYRRPENYLTEAFLARCAGLPVIWEHPKKSNLTSKEYSDRNIGSIMLPFIRGDEVWGVARIYDAPAIALMETEQLSTSPAVFFRNLGDNTKLRLEDGSVLLIEGKPSLLDHLAVCERGVWDKGGEPSGIEVQLIREDNDMSEAEKKAAEEKARQDAEKTRRDALSPEDREKEDKAKADADKEAEEKKKADAEAGTLLDKCLKGIDSIAKRMDEYDARDKAKADADAKMKADAEEEARRKGDPDVVAADKARKDAEEKAAAEDKEKKDAEERAQIKADSERARKDIEDLRSRLTPRSDEDHGRLMEAQSRADSVFAVHDGRAPRPLDGETELGYRRRIAAKLQPHSPAWKDVNLTAIADDAAFAIAEGQIYADADRAGRKPVELPAGTLREIITPDSTGRAISTFHGEPGAWISGFSGSRRRLTGIRNTT